MQQLLSQTETFDPREVARLLRDKNGINNVKIGLGNEKGINQLIAHHAVIFKPEDGLMWVSTAPYQLGNFICYDLNKVFSMAAHLNSAQEINEADKTIPDDPFLVSTEYKKFMLFKQLKNYIQFCTNSIFEIELSDSICEAFIRSNPESYLTYATLGDYYKKRKVTKLALENYQQALSKVVATQKEANEISQKLKELQEKHEK